MISMSEVDNLNTALANDSITSELHNCDSGNWRNDHHSAANDVIPQESETAQDIAELYDYCIVFPVNPTTGGFQDKGK